MVGTWAGLRQYVSACGEWCVQSACELTYAAYAKYRLHFIDVNTHTLRMKKNPVRRTRAKMMEETRAKLIAAARKAFSEQGFAEASMDVFTADVGLTRG